MSDETMTKECREHVAETLIRFFNDSEHSGISAKGAVEFAAAVEALIDSKIADSLQILSDRIQIKLGAKP